MPGIYIFILFSDLLVSLPKDSARDLDSARVSTKGSARGHDPAETSRKPPMEGSSLQPVQEEASEMSDETLLAKIKPKVLALSVEEMSKDEYGLVQMLFFNGRGKKFKNATAAISKCLVNCQLLL
jgi:hypothetical protein